VEANLPGAFFVVAPYVGYAQKDCAARFEKHIKDWPVPSLATPVRGSALEKDIARQGCNAFVRPPGVTPAQYEASARNNLGLTSDALLYLGPRKSLTFSPTVPDLYLDPDFRSEMDRRMVLRMGEHLTGSGPAGNLSSPRPFWKP
jgi:hypothetical protein